MSILIAILILLLILTIYLYLIRNNLSAMTRIYNLKGYIGNSNQISHYIREATEEYLALSLRMPGFDFDNEVYFDRWGNLRPIHPTPEMIEEARTDDEYRIGVEQKRAIDTARQTSSTAPSTSSSASTLPPQEPLPTMVQLTAEMTEMMRKDPVFLGMTSRSLINLSIAIAVQVAVVLLPKVMGKTATTAVRKIAINVSKRIATRIQAKIMTRVATAGTEKISARLLSRFGVKVGTRALMKMGLASARSAEARLGFSAIKKLMARAAAKASESATGKLAAKAAAELSAKASAEIGSMGPVGVALIVFDIISIGLDLGDAGGYMLLEKYEMIQSAIAKSFRKEIVDKGYKFPTAVGPLDKIAETEHNRYSNQKMEEAVTFFRESTRGREILIKSGLMEEAKDPSQNNQMTQETIAKILMLLDSDEYKEVSNIMELNACKTLNGTQDSDGVCSYPDDAYVNAIIETSSKMLSQPGNKFMATAMAEYTKWLDANPNAEQGERDAKADEMISTYIDQTDLNNEAMRILCIEKGGKPIAGGMCSYKDEKSCNEHYKINPETKLPEDTYTVWDPADKICKTGNWQSRQICEENEMQYDKKSGLCKITKELCLKKGAEYKAGKSGMGDCYLPAGQEIAEFIFGTTITRGLKQIFDPDQYTPCPAGWPDLGYACARKSKSLCEKYGHMYSSTGVSCTNSFDLRAPVPADCPIGYRNEVVICSRRPDSKSAPSTLPDCPSGYKNTGLTCTQINLDTIATGPPVLGSCPPGYNNTTISCFRPADFKPMSSKTATCPYGGRNIGALCHVDLDSYSLAGKTYPWKFGDGMNLNAARKRCEKKNPQGCFKWGEIIYPNCKAGYNRSNLSCYKNPPPGYNIASKTWPAFANAPISISTCPTGYHKSAGFNCEPNCPPGYTNAPLGCIRNAHTLGASSVSCPPDHIRSGDSTMCQRKCPSGYSNIAGICTRGSLNIKDSSAMSCPPGRVLNKITARCEVDCSSKYGKEYLRTGETCYRPLSIKSPEDMTCPKGKTKIGSLCFDKCPDGYVQTGISCQLKNPYDAKSKPLPKSCEPDPDGTKYKVILAKCYADKCPPSGFRDDGTLCWKKRRAAFSTKNN